MSNDFELGGRKFKVRKIDAFKQFHIVRRIAPVLSELLPAMADIKKIDKDESLKSEGEKFQEIAKVLSPILMGLSKLTDKDSEFVLLGLLSASEVQVSGAWTKVSTDNMLMVQDMELPMMLQVAARGFMFNLSNFFALLPTQPPVGR